jgi:hypothetical protein
VINKKFTSLSEKEGKEEDGGGKNEPPAASTL